VRTALEQPNAVVFGWQYHYYGGGSRTLVTFTDLEQYLRHIERAYPGDHFTLFRLDHLIDRAALHVGDIHSTRAFTLEDSTTIRVGGRVRPLQDVLGDEWAEILMVRRFVGPLTGTIDVKPSELPGEDHERRQDFARDVAWGRGELIVFDQAVFEEDEHGGVVTTITPTDRRRVNALVDAKRPDAEGLVPLGGSY
jgi:hypothetical protein